MKNILLIVISFFAALALCEVVGPSLEKNLKPDDVEAMDLQNFKADRAAIPDALLGYKLKSNTEIAGFRVNANGFVGPEIKTPKTKIRIFCMGGSTTLGAGAEKDQYAYPALLNRILDIAAPGKYEVINAGVFGYHSHHSLLRLHAQILALNPDIIVLMDGLNDVMAAKAMDQAGTNALNDFSRNNLFLLVQKEPTASFLERSYLYNKVKGLLHMRTGLSALPTRLREFGYEKNTSEIITTCQDKDIEVILVNYPWFNVTNETALKRKQFTAEDKETFRIGREELASINSKLAQTYHIPLFDAQPRFDALLKLRENDYKIYSDTVHFTRFSNFQLAYGIYDVLSKKLLKTPALPLGELEPRFPEIFSWNPGCGAGFPAKDDDRIIPIKSEIIAMQGIRSKFHDADWTLYLPEKDEGTVTLRLDEENPGRLMFFPRISGDGGSRVEVTATMKDNRQKHLFILENVARDNIWTSISGRFPLDASGCGTGTLTIRLIGENAQLWRRGDVLFFKDVKQE